MEIDPVKTTESIVDFCGVLRGLWSRIDTEEESIASHLDVIEELYSDQDGDMPEALEAYVASLTTLQEALQAFACLDGDLDTLEEAASNLEDVPEGFAFWAWS